MRVLPVTFSFKSTKTHTDVEHAFLYTPKIKPKTPSFEHVTIVAGVLASLVVVATLFNIGIYKKGVKKIFVV